MRSVDPNRRRAGAAGRRPRRQGPHPAHREQSGLKSVPPPTEGGTRGSAEIRDVVVKLANLDLASERVQSELARQLGIRPTDLRSLGLIGRTPGITPRMLADAIDLTTGAVTPLLDRLEQAGFVERHPHPHDRRSTILQLTPAGRHAREWGSEHYDRAIENALGETEGLSAGTASQFLAKLTEEMDAVEIED